MAIESMTGYARCVRETSTGMRLVCEMRSVNGKSLEIRLRLPNGLDRLEIPVRQLVQSLVHRGNLQVSISVETTDVVASLGVNEALVESLLELSGRLEARHGLSKPTIGELLSLRGVMEVAPEVAVDADDDILALVRESVVQLKVMRQSEGVALQSVLRAQLERMEALTKAAEEDPSRSVDAIGQRLKAQIESLMDTGAGLDTQRLHAEAVLLATRADIREELDRLSGHIVAARDLIASEGPAGKKLDFLSQEFNREANTLCSKSNAVTITRVGLELKSVVDQFREQVQNLE